MDTALDSLGSRRKQVCKKKSVLAAELSTRSLMCLGHLNKRLYVSACECACGDVCGCVHVCVCVCAWRRRMCECVRGVGSVGLCVHNRCFVNSFAHICECGVVYVVELYAYVNVQHDMLLTPEPHPLTSNVARPLSRVQRRRRFLSRGCFGQIPL